MTESSRSEEPEIDYLDRTLQLVTELNPMHAKRLEKTIDQADSDYRLQAQEFFTRYQSYLDQRDKDWTYAVECYLKVVSDTLFEQVRFQESGHYSCQSFADANEQVYSNPEVMDYYMNGLLMSQFLWKHHYQLFTFFQRCLQDRSGTVSRYLEIGGGHGAGVVEALKKLEEPKQIDVVDISPTSLEMTKALVNDSKVNYHLQDIFDYHPKAGYDFITLGEVLEHLEDPQALLVKIRDFLNPEGHLFVTVPANAPAIDHIYLFRSPDDIRKILADSGYKIVEEKILVTDNVTLKEAEQRNLPLLYGALLK